MISRAERLRPCQERNQFMSITPDLDTMFRSPANIPVGESVIRGMTRACQTANAVNLAQGIPSYPLPSSLEEAAVAAIRSNDNQYTSPRGSEQFLQAISEFEQRRWNMPEPYDPEKQICVTCGATEGMLAALLAVAERGSNVIIIEPAYESYAVNLRLIGVEARYVHLKGPDWELDPAAVAAVADRNTRAVIVNSPHNPTGRVFTRDETQGLADVCQRLGIVVIHDAIYDELYFTSERPARISDVPGMEQQSITINALSKMFSVTGWRVGWVTGSQNLMERVARVHDFLTIAAPTPFQAAGVAALSLPESYFDELRDVYRRRRDILVNGLEKCGIEFQRPAGAYYVMCDATSFALRGEGESQLVQRLLREAGVGVVPGQCFYGSTDRARPPQIRIAFAKGEDTVAEGVRRLHSYLSVNQ
ncbi:pyridoxal phosphate-dependent aminotransferase [Micromonospora sp. M71_S20]|uniref:pyridoxal phosphate-dependent aminotransferase n=1 Tax=Micromonospora sp. M71_S20 TaxID=592872 RepID=UPI0011E5FB76|nr:aminotransferase class I/II-fold pyridoxal phosphate-dependent enzyme [Micromonospora sp. M71_S20]